MHFAVLWGSWISLSDGTLCISLELLSVINIQIKSWKYALEFEGDVLSGLPEPESIGAQQSLTTPIELYGQIMYVNIRAFDEAGNHGGESNIVSLWVPGPPTKYAPPTTAASTTRQLPLLPASNFKGGFVQDDPQSIKTDDFSVTSKMKSCFSYVALVISNYPHQTQ